MTAPRAAPYDPTRAALYRPGAARDFFGRPGPRSRAALCAELSRLAYCDDAGARAAALARAGLQDGGFLDAHGTQAQVADLGPLRIVAFRGTDDPKALLHDLRVVPRAWRDGTRVHGGFVDHLEPVLGSLQSLAAQAGELVFTGHSLGAAAATLATSLWPRAALYTFGSPRVGDSDFVAMLRGSHVERFVGCCDVVCRVPPEVLGYAHAGVFKYIDGQGRLHVEPAADEVARDRRAAAREYVWRHAPRFWRNVLTRDLADHAPVNYAAAVP
jgi:hypothetical protein